MSINTVDSPFPIFTDIDGSPLEDGYIYIGETNQNPEVVPVTVYWDSSLTTPALQPIRTISGYPSRSGTASRVYIRGNYSITVRNKNNTLVYSFHESAGILGSINSFNEVNDLIGYTTAPENTSVNVSGYYSANDGAGGLFNWDSTIDKSTANAGTIIDPSVSLANQGTGVGLGCWVRQYSGAVNVKWFGAIGDGITDDTAAVQNTIDTAKILDVGINANGIYLLTSDLTLRQGTSLSGANRASLKFLLDGATITHEIIPNSNPACRDIYLSCEIESVNGTEAQGLLLGGVQYSTFDVKISGFTSLTSIGLLCTSIFDSSGAAWRYVTNNQFLDIEVTNCYKGIMLTKDATDPATFGANFNDFIGGYISGYTSIGVHVEFGEANTFMSTRCTTSIGSGSIGWLVEDSVNSFIATTADGSFGGTVPGTLNSYGFPHGRDGDLTTIGMKFNAGSNGCLLLNPRGDAPYERITFDSEITFNTITISGRVDFNRFPNFRANEIHAQNNSASAPSLIVENQATGTTELAVFRNAASILDGKIRMLSNGAIEIGSGDSELKFMAASSIVGRFQTTGIFRPEVDNTQSLGTAAIRWSVVYAGTGTINTSDARLKQQDRLLNEAEKAVAIKAKSLLKCFKFNDAIEAKGDKARIHFGIYAQELEQAFSSEGLNASEYAMFIYDEWKEELDEDGNVSIEAGNRYGIRYDELLAFIISAM